MRNEDSHEESLMKQIKRCHGDSDVGTKLPDPKMPKMIYEGDQVPGQRTNLAILRADLAFEEDAVKKYSAFAAKAKDDEVGSAFQELAHAERGHVNGLRTLINAIEEGKHEVNFFCPICGWSVPYGASPEIGTESRCRMCGVLFELGESNGDFKLRRR
jgi:rubrerythrin